MALQILQAKWTSKRDLYASGCVFVFVTCIVVIKGAPKQAIKGKSLELCLIVEIL